MLAASSTISISPPNTLRCYSQWFLFAELLYEKTPMPCRLKYTKMCFKEAGHRKSFLIHQTVHIETIFGKISFVPQKSTNENTIKEIKRCIKMRVDTQFTRSVKSTSMCLFFTSVHKRRSNRSKPWCLRSSAILLFDPSTFAASLSLFWDHPIINKIRLFIGVERLKSVETKPPTVFTEILSANKRSRIQTNMEHLSETDIKKLIKL